MQHTHITLHDVEALHRVEALHASSVSTYAVWAAHSPRILFAAAHRISSCLPSLLSLTLCTRHIPSAAAHAIVGIACAPGIVCAVDVDV